MSEAPNVKPLYEAIDLKNGEALLQSLASITLEDYDSPALRLTAAIHCRYVREQAELAAVTRLATKLGVGLPEGVA